MELCIGRLHAGRTLSQHLTFDILAWLAALAAAWGVWRWRLEDMNPLIARMRGGYFIVLATGGIIGAWLSGSLNLYLSGQPGLGRSILGGLVGAIFGVEMYKYRARIRGSTGLVFAVPLAVAISIGRIGCFSAGLPDFTYGIPSGLPWATDFGDGIPRHPVQLYESASMLLLLMVLLTGLHRRSHFITKHAFYVAVGVYGLQRFAWEFLKPYETLIGPFNVFHGLSLLLVGYAVWMIRGRRDVAA